MTEACTRLTCQQAAQSCYVTVKLTGIESSTCHFKTVDLLLKHYAIKSQCNNIERAVNSTTCHASMFTIFTIRQSHTHSNRPPA